MLIHPSELPLHAHQPGLPPPTLATLLKQSNEAACRLTTIPMLNQYLLPILALLSHLSSNPGLPPSASPASSPTERAAWLPTTPPSPKPKATKSIPAPAPQPVTSPHASQRPRGSASHMPSPAPVADGASAIGAVRTEIAALSYDPTLYSDTNIAAFLRQVEMSAKTDISAIAPPTSPSTALSSASPPPVQLPPSGDPAKHEPAPPPPVLKTELPPSCDIAQHH